MFKAQPHERRQTFVARQPGDKPTTMLEIRKQTQVWISCLWCETKHRTAAQLRQQQSKHVLRAWTKTAFPNQQVDAKA